MKKQFYKISNLLLSSVIGLLGFNSCKTTANKPAPQQLNDTIVSQTEPVKEKIQQPEPKPKPKDIDKMRVVYGPPTGLYDEVPGRIVVDKDQIYDIADTMPEFPGGEHEYHRWLRLNMEYPKEAKQKGIKGTVIMAFVVERDGKVSNVEVKKGVHPLLDKEAERLIWSMFPWTPGKNKGLEVRVRITLPIPFE